MFIRTFLSLLLLIPTFSVASDLTLDCSIEKFTLNLSDFGVDKNYNPGDKSVGNHNPALILYFIKDTLINNQAYSLEGQSFSLINLDSHIEINSNLFVNKDSKLKPLVFNSEISRCDGNLKNLTCSEINHDKLSAQLKIQLNDDYTSGTISAYYDNDEALLTKHEFSCK